MTVLAPITISIPTTTSPRNYPVCSCNSCFGVRPRLLFCVCLTRSTKFSSLHRNTLKLWSFNMRWALVGAGGGKDGSLMRKMLGRKKRVVLVRFRQGFGFNGGGSRKDDGTNARIVGNLALAVGLTYLSMTGQLGWVLDALVSIWLLAFLIPIIGLGAFIWWAGQDMIQGTCPNCGNDFQIFKSMLDDEVQLCPFCSQPFSVRDDQFVREPVHFSNDPTGVKRAFSGSSKKTKKGKEISHAVVDVEAEIKDAD